jgi:O-methyltransferase
MIKKLSHPHGNKKSFFMKLVKKIIENSIRFFVNFFCKLNKYDEIIISTATHAPWKKDKKFYFFYKRVRELTLLDESRAYTLWQCSKNVAHTNGDILDIGCLLGGAGFLMSKISKKGNTYMYDSFAGFQRDDGMHKKEIFFYKDINFVKKNIKKFNLKRTNVFKGYFPNQINTKFKKIKLCHIDVNTYTDTKNVFNFVKDKIIQGGFIVFDDFGIWGVDGIKKFIYEIEKKENKKFAFIKNYMGQCILIRR